MASTLKEKIVPTDCMTPRCCHVPLCGGCSIQQMDYKTQLREKERIVQGEFASLVDNQTNFLPILPCEDPWHYRNKMEFSFSQNRAGEKFLGLMIAKSRGKVFHLTECHLVSSWFTDVLKNVRIWWEGNDLQAYRHHRDQGHLRCLTVRKSFQGKGKMVLLRVSGHSDFALKKKQIESFIEAVKKAGEEDLSIFLQIQQIQKKRPTQFYEMLLSGPDHITEKLHISLDGEIQTLDFKISPTSFFQPNTLQAEKFYSKGLQMLSSLNQGSVLDLYCGGATLGLSAAKKAKEVIGIELNPYSVFDAKWNQEANGIENFSIFQGDVGKVLQEKNFGTTDVVIIDPPRAGLDRKALEALENLRPKEILFISCNPKTQAANVKELLQRQYRLKMIQPVDQFPHTSHIENICYLERG